MGGTSDVLKKEYDALMNKARELESSARGMREAAKKKKGELDAALKAEEALEEPDPDE